MKKKRLVIITPVYKKDISENEQLSIKSSLIHLSNYERVIIAPNKFYYDMEFIDKWDKYGYRIVFFEDKYFLNAKSYNKLMMNKIFYQTFSNYNYMLIVQLDVLIFSSSLDYWMDKDLDYVGAPWIINDSHGMRLNASGNGGLSLRKIETFIKVLESTQLFKKIKCWKILPASTYLTNLILLKFFLKFNNIKYTTKLFRFLYKGQEDFFWTYFAPFFIKEFKIANIKDALSFSFEQYPEFCFEKNNHCMPFGTHAWERYNPAFWKKYKASIFISSELEEKDKKKRKISYSKN